MVSYLFGVVIDELSIDEHVHIEFAYFVNFFLHFVFLGLFDFGKTFYVIGAHAWTEDFDLICVHGSVGK